MKLRQQNRAQLTVLPADCSWIFHKTKFCFVIAGEQENNLILVRILYTLQLGWWDFLGVISPGNGFVSTTACFSLQQFSHLTVQIAGFTGKRNKVEICWECNFLITDLWLRKMTKANLKQWLKVLFLYFELAFFRRTHDTQAIFLLEKVQIL